MPINSLIAMGGIDPEMESRKMRNFLGAFQAGQGLVQNQQNSQRLQMDQEKLAMEREKWAMTKERQPITDAVDAVNYLEAVSPHLTPENWDDSVLHLTRVNRFNPQLFPSLTQLEKKAMQEGVKSSGDFRPWFEQWKVKSLQSFKTRMALTKAQAEGTKVIAAGGKLVDASGNTIAANPKEQETGMEYKTDDQGNIVGLPKTLKPGETLTPVKTGIKGAEKKEAQPELLKLVDAYNSTTDPETSKFIMARINKLTETSGLRVTVNKDGEIELTQGPGVKSGTFGKPATTKLEEGLIESTDSLARLESIKAMFKPEYQQLSTRWSTLASTVKEKMGYQLSDENKSLLTDYSEYRRRAINNLNLHIKSITGAQMTEKEADRLTMGMPNPGKGLVDGDSPTEFEAKVKGIMQELRMGIARKSYALRTGASWQTVSLDAMPQIMNERGAAIEKDLSRKYQGDELQRMVKARLMQEFGLAAGGAK